MTERALFDILIVAWLVLAGVTFVSLLWVVAPYGRHARSGWGPAVPARAGWLVMELPAVVVPFAMYLLGNHRGAAAVALLVAWEVHYVHRALVYPFRLPPGGRPMPVSIVGMAVLFNLVNGYVNGRWLFTLGPERGADWLTDPRFVVGMAVFAVGLAVNLHADTVLLNLRRRRDRSGGYVVPEGGLFRVVSCPNYLGEVLEWTGWALAAWSLAGLSFALWTAANLVPRALAHHRWYRETFPDYPAERKAIFPGLL